MAAVGAASIGYLCLCIGCAVHALCSGAWCLAALPLLSEVAPAANHADFFKLICSRRVVLFSAPRRDRLLVADLPEPAALPHGRADGLCLGAARSGPLLLAAPVLLLFLSIYAGLLLLTGVRTGLRHAAALRRLRRERQPAGRRRLLEAAVRRAGGAGRRRHAALPDLLALLRRAEGADRRGRAAAEARAAAAGPAGGAARRPRPRGGGGGRRALRAAVDLKI